MLRSILAASSVVMALAAALLSPALPSPALAQGAPRTQPRTAAFSSLGPLAPQVSAGQSGAWTVRDDAGQAVLSNPAAAGAIRYYVTDWQGDLAAGRSASVRVTASGGAGLSQAGLVFRMTNDDPRWVAYVLGADGKLGLFVRRTKELKRTGTFDIPGGHRAEGDVLTLNQRGDTAQLLANGYLVTELKPDGGLDPNAPAPIGVMTMGIGEFSLGDFAFGKLVTPAALPTPPQVSAGNDDSVPVPAPTPAPTPTPTPTQAPKPPPSVPVTPRLTEVQSLGPLGHNIRLGDNQGWNLALEDGQLVFTHSAEDDLYYFNRSIPWTGPAGGRSATVVVDSRGSTSNSGGGLLFGLAADGKTFWALEATGDGKVKLYHLKDNNFIEADTFDPPGGAGVRPRTLKIAQTPDGMSLYIDDKLVEVVPPDEPDGFDPAGKVGISMRGNGRFAFRDFAFGTPDSAAPAPPAPPPPASPSPAPPPPAAPSKPPAAPSAGASQTTEVPSLGPLGHKIKLGDNAGWDTSVQSGWISYTHLGDDDAGYFYRTVAWPNPADEGRSASITVAVQSDGEETGGGLTFGVKSDDKKLLIFAAAGDGNIRLFKIADNELSTLETFPGGQTNNRHTLKVSQRGDDVGLYVDDKLVKTMSAAVLGDMDGDVGLGLLGRGRYSFRDFAFGPAAVPPARPPSPGRQTPPARPLPISQPEAPRPRQKLESWTLESFGALFGILAHEFGHYMIGELKIPATGPEEDVADEFAAMVFIDNIKDAPKESAGMALGSALLWWFMANEHGDNATPFYDEHAPDRARFAKFACMMYGAAPDVFNELMDRAGIPDRTKQRCVMDEAKRHAAWDKLLTPYRRRGVSPNIPGELDPATPGHTVTVTYDMPKNPALRKFAEELKNSSVFELIADSITKQFVVPRDTRIVFRDCGVENCFYAPGDGSVTMCWEMISFVMGEFNKNGMNPTQGQAPGPNPTQVNMPGGNPGMNLDQFLIGRWRETASNNGASMNMLLELKPQSAYQAQIQVTSPQSMAIQVQGVWSVVPAGGNRAQIRFVPQRWTPPQAPMQPTSVDIELVDRNTFRSSDGLATRIP